MGGDEDGRADIPQEDLNLLRGILVSSLSRENLGPVDLSPPVPAPRRNRKVTFFGSGSSIRCASFAFPTADDRFRTLSYHKHPTDCDSVPATNRKFRSHSKDVVREVVECRHRRGRPLGRRCF
ncbi:unnamed protein product [Nesidiocoris tenuis]|uniref:Uncharacterized protein n=1 Tax=Nesidiocoris tenuis TaxID=355587 RepID=A0A6H5GPU8_9HEMI|nr:unnamed protein product [Nesidiocoris tenuis]CAB0004411.1 unnamed protein product [Nesidiocoris tenuis]